MEVNYFGTALVCDAGVCVCVCVCEGEREREGGRETERDRERKREREREREIDRERELLQVVRVHLKGQKLLTGTNGQQEDAASFKFFVRSSSESRSGCHETLPLARQRP